MAMAIAVFGVAGIMVCLFALGYISGQISCLKKIKREWIGE